MERVAIAPERENSVATYIYPVVVTPDTVRLWREKWIPALRSGGYTQAKSSLHNTAGFCCLGVLCDVALPNVSWQRDNEEIAFTMLVDGAEQENRAVIPEGFSEDLGIHDGQSIHIPNDVMTREEKQALLDKFPADSVFGGYDIDDQKELCLASLNDTGWSFEQIADAIEEIAGLWDRQFAKDQAPS